MIIASHHRETNPFFSHETAPIDLYTLSFYSFGSS